MLQTGNFWCAPCHDTGAPGISAPSRNRRSATFDAHLQQLQQARAATTPAQTTPAHGAKTHTTSTAPVPKPAHSWLYSVVLFLLWASGLTAAALVTSVLLATPNLAQNIQQLGAGPTAQLAVRRAARMARAAVHQLRNELQAGAKRLPVDTVEAASPLAPVPAFASATEKLVCQSKHAVSAGLEAVCRSPVAHAAAAHFSAARRAARALATGDSFQSRVECMQWDSSSRV